MARLLLVLFVVATALAIWVSVAGEDMVWLAWYVAGVSLLNLVGNRVINPWLRRRHLQRLAAAERGNLETLGRPST
jgi:hypothetical protein